MAELTEEGTSKFAQAGDIQLHYNEAGSGDAVIMLHGGGPGASGWSNFKQNMEAFSKHYRVLLVDQPGFGKSDKPDHGEYLGAYNARAIRDLMDTLGIEKAHLLGNSMGGLVTLKFAVDHPDRANRLVLMGPANAGVGPSALNPTEGIKVIAGFYRGEGPTVEKMKGVVNALVYDASEVPDSVMEERFASATEPEALAWQSKHMFNPKMKMEQVWREIDQIKHKTLAMWGRDDRVTPFDRGLFVLQQMPDVRLHVFSHCGHWVQVEQADAFNRLALDFLQAP